MSSLQFIDDLKFSVSSIEMIKIKNKEGLPFSPKDQV